MKNLKALTAEQKATLTSKGFDTLLFDVLTLEQLHELLVKAENTSLTIKTKKTRSNINFDIEASFTEDVHTFTKDELVEKIRILNQTNFFDIKLNEQTFLLTNSVHAKVFMMLKDYKFTTALTDKNKKIAAAVDEKNKVLISVGLWLVRAKAILSEITNINHAKYYNSFKELNYKMEVDGQNVIFTKK